MDIYPPWVLRKAGYSGGLKDASGYISEQPRTEGTAARLSPDLAGLNTRDGLQILKGH